MPRIIRRTLEGRGRMPTTFSLTREFSSCVAVYFEWAGNALSGLGPRKTMFSAELAVGTQTLSKQAGCSLTWAPRLRLYQPDIMFTAAPLHKEREKR